MTSFRSEKYRHPASEPVDKFVMIWDLETSNLSPKFGFMLCGGWKAWRGGKGCPCHNDHRVHMPSMRDQWEFHECAEKDCGKQHRVGPVTDDRYITKAVSDALRQADVHVTYNGKRYDWRWVQTRRLMYGWDLLPTGIPHVDLLYTVRTQIAGGASLKAISGSDPVLMELGLAKTPVTGPQWINAVSGDSAALKYVETHCKKDVLVLEAEYERFQGHVWQHPRLAVDRKACKFCEGPLIQCKKRHTALANPVIQYQCRKCFKYQTLAVKAA